MNAKVLVIMASGGWKFVEVEMKRGKVPLEFLQTAVGGWVECLGQCQSAPNLLINGKLFQNVDAGSIPTLLGGEK